MILVVNSTEIESQQWYSENTGGRFRSKTLAAALDPEKYDALGGIQMSRVVVTAKGCFKIVSLKKYFSERS